MSAKAWIVIASLVAAGIYQAQPSGGHWVVSFCIFLLGCVIASGLELSERIYKLEAQVEELLEKESGND